MMPSGLRKASSPSQRFDVGVVTTSRGTWSRIAWMNNSAAASRGAVDEAMPMSDIAPSLQNSSRPFASNTMTASCDVSRMPTSRSLNIRLATDSVTSTAVPMNPESSPRTTIGWVDTCTQIDSPSARTRVNSWENGVFVSRERCQASSAAARSAGVAFTHGAAPGVRDAPPRASWRKASLAAVRRPFRSVSNTPMGREATERSMTPSWQVGFEHLRRVTRRTRRRMSPR